MKDTRLKIKSRKNLVYLTSDALCIQHSFYQTVYYSLLINHQIRIYLYYGKCIAEWNFENVFKDAFTIEGYSKSIQYSNS